MVSKVYTVYDSKVEAYLPPFMAQTKGHAVRMFSDEVNNEQSALHRHPEDYTLFEIGEFDDAKGVYSMHEAKQPLGTALEFKKQMEMFDSGREVSVAKVVK